MHAGVHVAQVLLPNRPISQTSLESDSDARAEVTSSPAVVVVVGVPVDVLAEAAGVVHVDVASSAVDADAVLVVLSLHPAVCRFTR